MSFVWVSRAVVLLSTTLATAAYTNAVASPSGACDHPITVSAKDDSALRDAFNHAHGSVRLVFLVDPICPTCLRGIKDLDTAVLSPLAANRSLQSFVIHTPVLGATETDTKNTCALIHNDHVVHYWDPAQEIGSLFSNAEGMKIGDREIYAWDVWLVYGPDAQWTGAEPPKADFRMHQLPDLMGHKDFPFLNAAIVNQFLNQYLETGDETAAIRNYRRWLLATVRRVG